MPSLPGTSPGTTSAPSPKHRMPDLTVSRDRNACTAHTRQPWTKDSHRHDCWPAGLRKCVMWGLVVVVAGVLVTALVFAVDAGLRSAGVMTHAGAGGGPAGYKDEQSGRALDESETQG